MANMTEIILNISETSRRHGWFTRTLANSLYISLQPSREPFLDTARVLLAHRYEPATILQMVTNGTPSLRGPIGQAAKLRVTTSKSGRPIFQVAAKDSSKPAREEK
jgi:hypothetical protein